MNPQSKQKGIGGAPILHLQGQAGVWRVASMLALRGLNPHFPGVDHGYDLSLEGGVRLQVKSAHLGYTHHKQGSYTFSFRRFQWVRSVKAIKPFVREFSEKCEFVVLWGIEQDRFWVVPSPALDNVALVTVGPDIHWKNIDMDWVGGQKEAGRSQHSIAQELGVSDSAISHRVNGRRQAPQQAVCERVRQYENRWDLVESCVCTMLGKLDILPTLDTVIEEME